MDPTELGGLWSTDNQGGHSDETLVFFPNGTGAIDYYNVVFAGRTEFHWSLVGPGRLKIAPRLWILDTVETSIFEDGGRLCLRINFADSSPDTGIAHQVTLNFLKSSLPLEDYKLPQEPIC